MIRAAPAVFALLWAAGALAADSVATPTEVDVWRASLQYEISDKRQRVHIRTTRVPAQFAAGLLSTAPSNCPGFHWPADTANRMDAVNETVVRLDDSIWAMRNVKRARWARGDGNYLSLSRPVFDETGTRAVLVVVPNSFSGDLLEARLVNGTWTIRKCSDWLEMY
jgi:hypothetical protein